jgi:hypothetical protein
VTNITWLIFVMLLTLSPCSMMAQNIEVNGGWAHNTGDCGLDGFEIGAAFWFTPKVSIAFNYDDTYDTSRIGLFELTSTGQISTRNHLQNFLVGPRIFFVPRKVKKYRFSPFVEAQFGESRLHTELQQAAAGTLSPHLIVPSRGG